MSIPAYLDETVYPLDSDTVFGLADVESGGVGAISTMRTLALALGWTEPSTNLFKTPVDSAGRFLDVLMTRISATVLEWRVRNASGTTVCTRRMTLGTGMMFMHVSTVGVYIEFVQTAQNGNHNVRAFLLDMAPDVPGDHSLYVVGNGFHTTSSTNDSLGDAAGEYFAIDNGSAASANRMLSYARQADGTVIVMRTASGRLLLPECAIQSNFAGTVKWAGRIPHAVVCDQLFNGGDERDIEIDSNTVRTFRASSSTAIDGCREMFRKAQA